MPGAGFIGATHRTVRRRRNQEAGFAVTLTGLSAGRAEFEATVSFDVSRSGLPDSQRWQSSENGFGWADIPDATDTAYQVSPSSSALLDGHFLRVAVTIDGLEEFSPSARIVQVAPTVIGSPDSIVLISSSGAHSVDLSQYFSGSELRYSVTETPGVSIDEITGIASFDTDVLGTVGLPTISVSAFNSGGIVIAPFVVEFADMNLRVSNVGEEPLIELDGGALNLTIDTGPYAGTYGTDFAGVPLTVEGLNSNHVCLVRPAIEGSFVVGSELTILPGLWIYVGDDPGDVTWHQWLDGMNISEGEASSYTLSQLDDGSTFVVDEIFDGEIARSLPVMIDLPDIRPFEMASPTVVPGGTSSVIVTLASDPYDGGAQITSRDLRYSDDNINWTVIADVSNEIPVTGLDDATQYFVQTRANNIVGTGDWSQTTSATTYSTVFIPSNNPKVAVWLDYGDQNSLFTDSARSNPVSVSGDVIIGVSDKSGNSNHAEHTRSNGHWDEANGQLDAVEQIRLDVPGFADETLGTTIEVFVAIASNQASEFVMMSRGFGSWVGFAKSDNSNPPQVALSGDPPQYRVDNTILTPNTSDALHTALSTSLGVVFSAHDISSTDFAGEVLRLLAASANRHVIARIKNIVVAKEPLTESERAEIITFMQEELPV